MTMNSFNDFGAGGMRAARYVEQEPRRKEADHLRNLFEDEVVAGRSPSLSRLKRW